MKDQLQTIREAVNELHNSFPEKERALTALAQLEAMAGEQQPVALAQIEHTVGGSIEHMPLKAAWKLPMGVRFDLYAAPVAQQPQADLLAAAKEFCRKVEAGEARSTKSYAAFKSAIERIEKQPQAEAVPNDVVRDAARYRWLRDASVPPHNFYISVPDEFHGVKYQPGEVDAYIDAAIAAQGEKP